MSALPEANLPPEFTAEQENDAVPSRKVAVIMLVSVVIAIVSVAISGRILAVIQSARPVHPPSAAATAPKEIARIHQTRIGRDHDGWDLRGQQRRSLEQYRWVDRSRGVAQIPIDRAMQIVVESSTKERGAR